MPVDPQCHSLGGIDRSVRNAAAVLGILAIQPAHRLSIVNAHTLHRSSPIAATLGMLAAGAGLIMLLLAIACFLFVSAFVEAIGSAFQQALLSPEFQAQLSVIAIVYLIAAALMTAWNHFESLFEVPDAVIQGATAALNALDSLVSAF